LTDLHLLIFSLSAQIIKSQLGIEDDWFEPGRWLTLSHGERKRVQIAVALWLEPGFSPGAAGQFTSIGKTEAVFLPGTDGQT